MGKKILFACNSQCCVDIQTRDKSSLNVFSRGKSHGTFRWSLNMKIVENWTRSQCKARDTCLLSRWKVRKTMVQPDRTVQIHTKPVDLTAVQLPDHLLYGKKTLYWHKSGVFKCLPQNDWRSWMYVLRFWDLHFCPSSVRRSIFLSFCWFITVFGFHTLMTPVGILLTYWRKIERFSHSWPNTNSLLFLLCPTWMGES